MPEDLKRLSGAATIAKAVYSFFVNPQTVETFLREPGRGDFTAIEAARTVGSSLDPNVTGPQGVELLDHQPNDPTGFSATVFYDRSSNKYVLGIRGSEQFTDYVEDISRIGFQGFAGDQLVSLYRYYRKLTTPAGQRVQYSDSEVSMLKAIQLGIGTNLASLVFNVGRTATLRDLLAQDSGIVPKPGSGPSVLPSGAPLVVTGHSLGGHLALLFGRFFPDVTEHVYTYNAPGIGPQGELFLRAIGVPPSPSSLVTNVSAAMGTEAISKIPAKPGDVIAVATEPGNVFYQHNIVPLTDALALYGVFGTLSPGASLDAAAVSGVISAASPFPEDALEVVLDHLGKLLDTGNASTPITRTNADLDQRNAYYVNLYEVLDSRVPGLDYEIESLVGKTVVQVASLAASNVSVLYALNELMPFHAKNADYSSFDGSAFSGSWIASRAEMLEAMLAGNLVDRPFGFAGAESSIVYRDVDSSAGFSLLDGPQYQAALLKNSSPADRQALLDYLDGATYARSVIFGSNSAGDGDLLMGLSGGDRLFGGAGEDYLDGESGDDYLSGGAGDDFLAGGAGDDTLDGDEGADHLEGGAGSDTYVFGPALDADTIVDRDGQVYAGTTRLVGGIKGEDGNYRSSDGRFSYVFSGDLTAGGTLVVDGLLRIENFHNDDLGIQLSEQPVHEIPWIPVPETILLGDFIYIPREIDDQLFYPDRYNNPVPEMRFAADPGRSDLDYEFPGTPGNTYFSMGGGNDIIQDYWDGDDRLDLGPGDDLGFGARGNDLLEGGEGRDMLAGGRGDDVIVAGTIAGLEFDLDENAVPVRSDSGDLLSGGDGDDLLLGDAEANVIEGGAGLDRIFAGSGDDWIGSDVAELARRENYAAGTVEERIPLGRADSLWSPGFLASFSLESGTGFGSPAAAVINGRTLNALFLAAAAGEADTIDAGPGNDTVVAGGGDDVIFGGLGDDYIDAGTGQDTVYGGDGRDYIIAYWDDVGDYFDAGGGADNVNAGGGDDFLMGGDGDDRLHGGEGNDVIIGGEGRDFLSSSGGNDIFDPGPGDDQMFAYAPGSIVRVYFGEGYGADLIEAREGTLVVDMLGSIVPGEVAAARGTRLIPARDGPAAFETLTGIRLSVGAQGDELFIGDIFPEDQHAAWRIEFSDGTVWDEDEIAALLSPSSESGAPSAFPGTAGGDLIYGSSGADTFSGGEGDDWLLGGAGNDLYQYASGDGFDTIEDADQTPGNSDVLRFADGIGADDVTVYAVGDDYVLTAGTDGVRIREGRTQGGAVERVEFSDGSFWAPGDLEARAEVLPDNRAPSLPSAFAGVAVDPGSPLEVVLPQDAISDPDRFDSVSLYAITADGERLPDWLHFDAASRTLSGTPVEANRGVHELLIIAADTNGAAAVSSLTIAVGADIPVQEDATPEVSEQAPALISSVSVPGEAVGADAPAVRVDSAPRRQDEAFSVADATPLPASAQPRFGESADPAFREVQHSTDVLLQTGRANLGERYAEAIREFEDRRQDREREDAPPPPPPTEEEVEAWNAAMHSWHDRNPGFAETELGGNDGTWSMGWGLPVSGDSSLGGAIASSSLPGLANPNALGRVQSVASAPALSEGIRQVR